MDRLEQLRIWASGPLGGAPQRIVAASEDASFRRYFRVIRGSESWIAMDAPPEMEDCRPFVRIAGLLREAGVNAPQVLAADLAQGFLLLTDFGSTTYLDALGKGGEHPLYDDALETLIRIQRASRPGVLPEYDHAMLAREVALFPQWYVRTQLGYTLTEAEGAALQRVIAELLAQNLSQARVYVHRDYHTRNLMVTEPNPGVLDFQDAVYGPITYDLVSLLRDAYVEWPEERVLDWAIRYWEKARGAGLPVPASFADFYRDFEWMGVQRHLKVLGIFARLFHRDGKSRYLADLPLVLRYLERATARYRELAPLAQLLGRLHGRVPGVGHSF